MFVFVNAAYVIGNMYIPWKNCIPLVESSCCYHICLHLLYVLWARGTSGNIQMFYDTFCYKEKASVFFIFNVGLLNLYLLTTLYTFSNFCCPLLIFVSYDSCLKYLFVRVISLLFTNSWTANCRFKFAWGIIIQSREKYWMREHVNVCCITSATC